MNLSKKLSASGLCYTGPCELNGILIGTDGINDITDLTVYDNTAASGDEKIPTSDYEADYKGLNGAVGLHMGCGIGLYLEFTCAGTAEVTVFFRPL